ncbi:MAG: type ISP restriction/modification enzyme [Sphingomonadaceae bacterium]
MKLVEDYLHQLRLIHASRAGVPELSYYVPLADLLNAIGKTLKPRVHCIIALANRGAGFPDGGLFTSDQLQEVSEADTFSGQLPSRGVIEIKPLADDTWATAEGEQVTRYWGEYGQVLVTNYWDFVLVGHDADGNPAKLDTYRLAESEAEFWAAAAHPGKLAQQHADSLVEFLTRVMRSAAPLGTPQDVAWFLASYARDAKTRVEAADLPALSSIRTALEEALGIKFEGPKGEHFFRSTLVQTLFYGVFSAWVIWARQPGRKPGDHFDWKTTAWHLRVPMIRALFEQVGTPTQLGPLGLVEVLDRTGDVLNRVNRDTFFAQFEDQHAVQYFYEPFLAAYDPKLRKEMGVWYTPREIVQYQVARVDTVLREELGVEDGLADPSVYVLDPCCGTGTYLVEVLNTIAGTLKAKGSNGLLAHSLKRAVMDRVIGFEILPAPFVVAHLQMGLLLQQKGAPLSDSKNERVGVYLTNSLTGWEPPDPEKERVIQLHLSGLPQLQEERDAAEKVKRKTPILVILGNPPYNAFAGVSPKEEQGLVEPYKVGLSSIWGIRKYNLDDLYIRFFRLAERRIAEQGKRGIVSFISNFSYLNDPSYVVMRQRFLSQFDKMWFDSLNGDSRETGKLTPDGEPDPSVFSTDYNREGIRLGTAVSVLVRKADRSEQPEVLYREFWGVNKRTDLLESLGRPNLNTQYESPEPSKRNRLSFRPWHATTEYLSWPAVVELCGQPPVPGLQEMRRGALIDIDPAALSSRMEQYYKVDLDWEAVKALGVGPTADTESFAAKPARATILAADKFDPNRVVRYALYPMDRRWCYYSPVSPLWNRPRPMLAAQNWTGNRFFVTRMVAERPKEGVPAVVTRALPDYHLLRPNVEAIPMRLRNGSRRMSKASKHQLLLLDDLGEMDTTSTANLSPRARAYLSALGITDPDASQENAELIWMHALAINYSPAYLAENSDGVRGDWPRIPLPGTRDTLLASAALGRQLAALLDPESPVTGVTVGSVRPELKVMAGIASADGRPLNPDTGDLAVTAGWGHPGQDGIVMPGRGKTVLRSYEAEELAAIELGAGLVGLGVGEVARRLGETTYDVFLNDRAYWRNVPERVWEYTIGGYQVVKKWLSYRESKLLGRSLTASEAGEVTNMVRRLAAALLLGTALDANYQMAKEGAYEWPAEVPVSHPVWPGQM